MSGRLLRSICTAAMATVVAAAPAFAVPVDPPVDPQPTTVAGALSELQTLYQQAEEASETYNATAADLKAQTAETKRLDAQLAKVRISLAGGRSEIGRMAREQYQGQTGLSDYLQLLLARSPQEFIDQGHQIERASSERLARVSRLEGSEKAASGLAARSQQALDTEQVLAAKQKRLRDGVQSRLKAVEALLASLTAEQLADVARLEQASVDGAQRTLIGSGVLGGSPGVAARAPSVEGDSALKYAVRQIGKPYVWGAEGPSSFDCSGLTSQAWAHAGRVIPRTSEEQWAQLPRVSLRALRPGDLVVYFPKATHVAIYLGGGMVVQAPRPGDRVKVSPIASNPLLGAVRPDPGGRAMPVASYAPPVVPEISPAPPLPETGAAPQTPDPR
ncbi:NlpC/P60 family protein [Streptomyces sp. NPDC050738]|uniref:C40 family peptidase n=1 Tax=Streptomyces sp. NPDC050738 TaxID=3154744 RepID=UPI00342239A1